MKQFVGIIISMFIAVTATAQERRQINKPDFPYVSKVWVADDGDGTYKNPIIHADYSDPDAIRVGDDYYMIASSFDAVPCLPILHSKDLVNWTIIGHALNRQIPIDHFSSVQHGNGVWAPSIRYHNNELYIYYPDPDYGIYLTKATNITGPWSKPVLVQAGKGLIDPCPLWDDNGNAYLVHAYAGSRAGIKSIIVVKKLNSSADKVVDSGIIVYDGHKDDPTIEGPKFYKRNGYYYIFAPAGGVTMGWQLVLRSKNVYGPYERKVVMDQGSTNINGPHQGAWVQTQTGEDWFIHFQDKGAYGRIVHLQPMQWKNDWPIIGLDKDTNGKGEPVLNYKKPNVGTTYPICSPQESDEFNDTTFGLQWQWQANPKDNWAKTTDHSLILHAVNISDAAKNYWYVPNILLQKFPAEEFTATTKLYFDPGDTSDRAGLIIMGADYASLSLIKKPDGMYIDYAICKQADKGLSETDTLLEKFNSHDIYLQVTVTKNAVCNFSYSKDNIHYRSIAASFTAKPGRWIGAKIGLFCTSTEHIAPVHDNDAVASMSIHGDAYIDWFRIE